MILFVLPSCRYLGKKLLKSRNFKNGILKISRFSNQEIRIDLKTKVRGQRCVILGNTAPPDGELLSLLLLAHTLKKEGAKEIIAIIPYLGYSRQDRDELGKSFATKWMGELLRASFVDKIVTIDIHSNLISQFFSVPLVSLSPAEVFAKDFKKYQLDQITFVAPDEGAIDNCKSAQEALGISGDIAYFKKTRTSKGIILSGLYGKVQKTAIIVDDVLDTGNTLVNCVKKLNKAGVKDIVVAISHGLFVGKKWKDLFKMGVKKIYCTNSFYVTQKPISKKIAILPIESIIIKYFS